MKKKEKTNVMRVLDSKKIKYNEYYYGDTEAVSGVDVAKALGQNPENVFKTLVTTGKSGEHYVFMVPVAEELDLKKAAKAVGEKSIAMLKSKELLGLTGYIHGGFTTLCPSLINDAQRLEPIKPAPPATNMFIQCCILY